MILELAGAELPADRVLDGRDPLAELAGEAAGPERDLFFRWGSRIAVRSGRYKLVRNHPDQPFELYDLSEDLGESRNLAAEKPELVRRLAGRFDRWQTAVRRDRWPGVLPPR